MRHFSCIFVSLLFFSGGAQAAAKNTLGPVFTTPREIRATTPERALRSIRIVTWNIDRGTRVQHVIEDMKNNPADLCLFQEVDWGTARTHGADIAAELAKALHLNAAYGVTFEELGQEIHGHPAYIGSATLTRLPIERIRILRFRHQTWWWKPRPWFPSKVPFFQRRLGGRIALVTELRFAGKLLVVYNVHLESRSLGKIQKEEMNEVQADSERYPAGAAIIVGGDFNSKYFPSDFLKNMESRGYHSALGQRVERTHKIAMALDWIFAKGPIELRDGHVRKDLHNASDHFPVFARLIAR